MCCLWNYVGGARLYRSQTARVNAPVWPLIASGPQFHLLVRGADPEPVRGRFVAYVGILCDTVRSRLLERSPKMATVWTGLDRGQSTDSPPIA